MLSVLELHERGRARSDAGRFAAARADFLKALSRADTEEVRGQVEASLAYVESETGRLDQGLELCERALGRTGLSPRVSAIIHSQLGLLYMRAGDGSQALTHLDSAVSGLDALPRELGNVHLNRANVYLQQGDVRSAVRDLEAAAKHFETAGQPIQLAKARHNLGYTLMLTGDLVSALDVIDSAKGVLGSLSMISHAVGEQDRAEVLVAAGMTDEAGAALMAASKAYGSRRLRQRQAEAELIWARTLLADDPQKAATIARRAARRFRRRGSEVWALRSDAVALAGEVGRGTRSRGVVVHARELATRLRRHDLVQDALVLELHAVRVSVRRGDLGSARVRLRTVRTTQHTPVTTRLLAREVRSELAAAEGHRGAALQHVRKGLSDLHAWQSSFGSLDLQSSLVGHGRDLAVQGMRLALENGRPDLVFEWSERTRALSSRVAPLRPPSDADAAEDLTELRRLQADSRDSEVLAKQAARRMTDLRRRIRQRAWYGEGSRLVTEPFDLTRVQEQLRADDAALVAYLNVDDRLRALVATDRHAHVLDLGPLPEIRTLLEGMQADLDIAASKLSAAMRATVVSGLQHRLQAVANHLVSPIAAHLGDRRLVLTPAGVLSGVPWTMLPGFAEHPLTVPRSASTWLSKRRPAMRLESAGFAAGPRVSRADEEVHVAAAAWPSAGVLTGDDAQTSAVTSLAASVDLLHVSAHGRHSADNPLFSGLELADGPWFGYDIDQVGNIPEAVVLSACELGRSAVRWGEEAIGMTTAWLHAGTRCVIASPASVDDDVACETLSAAHQLVASGSRPADALAEAAAGLAGPLPPSFVCYGTGW